MVSTISPSLLVSLSAYGGAIGILVLVFLLVQKEFLDASGKKSTRRNNTLYIGIVPLLFIFSFVVISRLVEILK